MPLYAHLVIVRSCLVLNSHREGEICFRMYGLNQLKCVVLCDTLMTTFDSTSSQGPQSVVEH